MDKLTAIFKQQKKEFDEILTIYQEDIESQFNSLIKEISYLKSDLSSKDNEITTLNSKLSDNTFNQQNYQNFSMVSNLSKQITEKELEIKKYQSQLRSAKKEIDTLKEKLEVFSEKGDDEIEPKHELEQEPQEQQLVKEEVKEEVEEQEVSYVRKKIKGVYYYLSDEEPPLIYECLENNEVGEVSIGKMNGKKAEFY